MSQGRGRGEIRKAEREVYWIRGMIAAGCRPGKTKAKSLLGSRGGRGRGANEKPPMVDVRKAREEKRWRKKGVRQEGGGGKN